MFDVNEELRRAEERHYEVNKLSQSQEELLATLQHVTPSSLEVACVPRICHIARATGKVHKQ
jgi:hypothetical protein